MSRSLKKGPYIDEKLIAKLKKVEDKKKPIKTWSRSCVIVPEMVGFTFGVHNGREFIPVNIIEEMVGQRLGEFSKTRKFFRHGGRMAREQEMEARSKTATPAGEGSTEKTAPAKGKE
jgi:small subunit ribosomal protein S19